MNAGVIFTTYNSPAWLTKVLWGYEQQTDRNVQIIIADDGSGAATADVIDRFKKRGLLSIKHVWHEDNGFRKCEILNKAIIASDCDYLIFSDGDCVPRNDFVAQHKSHARPGYFLAASCQRLSLPVSQTITELDVVSGRAFNGNWLLKQGQPFSSRLLRLFIGRGVSELLNRVSWLEFRGGNSSAWRTDIEGVNGFNELMEHGGLDTEFGSRLINLGIRPLPIPFSAICLHLEHSRGYVRPEVREVNLRIIRDTVDQRIDWTPHGISKGDRASTVLSRVA